MSAGRLWCYLYSYKMGACCCKNTDDEQLDSHTRNLVTGFVKKIRPFDLLVFRGADGVSSLIGRLEERATGKGSVSHVEVAINREWCSKIKPLHSELETDTLDDVTTMFSWGSTLSGPLNDGAYNAETNKATFGVQLRVLEDLIASYLKNPDANVGYCRLLHNPIARRSDESAIDYKLRCGELKLRVDRAYNEYSGRTYNANPFALLGSMFPTLRPLRNASDDILEKLTGDKWLFCSEFVALLYQSIGVITDSTDGVDDGKLLNAGDVLPIDFLGCDADKDGLVNDICEYPPTWIK